MRPYFLQPCCAVLLLAFLGGCGVDTATTAAAVAKLKAEELKAAQQQKERAEKKLEELNQITQERLQNADTTETGNAP
ncbi:MAG: hypothetical protein LBR88_04160 [Zoogloeaceae bacterium]|nr:hypothetical protein [Zoogloeaceae bacterium]